MVKESGAYILSLFLIQLSIPAFAEDLVRITDPSGVYSIELPSDWEYESTGRIFSIKKDGLNIAFYSTTYQFGATASDMENVHEAIAQTVKKGFPFLRETVPRYPLHGENWEGFAIEYEGVEPNQKEPLHVIQVFAAARATSLQLRLTGTIDEFKAHETALRSAIRSLIFQ